MIGERQLLFVLYFFQIAYFQDALLRSDSFCEAGGQNRLGFRHPKPKTSGRNSRC